MKSTRTRLVGVAAALATIAVAVPVSTASAATADPVVATVPIAAEWGGSQVAAIEITGPVAGQEAVVIGPAIITSAPASFVNTNNQVSAGSVWSGGQSAG